LDDLEIVKGNLIAYSRNLDDLIELYFLKQRTQNRNLELHQGSGATLALTMGIAGYYRREKVSLPTLTKQCRFLLEPASFLCVDPVVKPFFLGARGLPLDFLHRFTPFPGF